MIGRKALVEIDTPIVSSKLREEPSRISFLKKMGHAAASSGGKEVPHFFSRSHLASRFSLLQSFDLAFPLVRFLFRTRGLPSAKKD